VISFLRDLILKDFGLKLVSLALAALLYFTISVVAIRNETPALSSLSLDTETLLFPRIPVMVLSSASDVHDFRVDPQVVAVTVQGDAKRLAALQSSEIRAWVDLTGVEAAARLRNRIEISTPSGVSYVRVQPAEVRVIFPRKGQP
jgi:YbbR domain-containing protein